MSKVQITDKNQVKEPLKLTEHQQILLLNADTREIQIHSDPDSSTNSFVAVPSGTMADILSAIPVFNGMQNWYEVNTITSNIYGWVEQADIVLLSVINQDYFDTFCPGAGGYHFVLGQRFIVPFSDGETSIWAEPNNHPRVGRVNEGSGGYILDGPECVSGQSGNLLSWYARSDDGVTGWMSEGYRNSVVPWIVPMLED